MEVLYNINEPLRSEDIDVPLTNVRPVKKVALVIVAGDSWSLWRFGQYIPRSRPRTSSLTTPLDVEKTRLMTQVHGGNKVAAVMYSGVNALLKLILKEEAIWSSSKKLIFGITFLGLIDA
ncbi:hypothetical protein Gohar_025852, partial [Gossypium harknessii]|nr:hypothetical protein [Gossypium harknessii]